MTDWQGIGFMALVAALMLGVISAISAVVDVVGSVANSVVTTVGAFANSVVGAISLITMSLLICAASVASLVVIGLSVREVVRLRAGTLVELARMECEAIEEKS